METCCSVARHQLEGRGEGVAAHAQCAGAAEDEPSAGSLTLRAVVNRHAGVRMLLTKLLQQHQVDVANGRIVLAPQEELP